MTRAFPREKSETLNTAWRAKKTNKVDKLAINVDNPDIMCTSASISETQITMAAYPQYVERSFPHLQRGYLEICIYPQKVGITFTHIAKEVDKKEKISPARVHNLSPDKRAWG